MLTLTDNAVLAIRSIVGEPRLPEAAGLRIASGAGANGAQEFGAELTGGPGPADQVIDEEGARVFLDPAAAGALDHMMLDAQVNDRGEVSFQVMERTD